MFCCWILLFAFALVALLSFVNCLMRARNTKSLFYAFKRFIPWFLCAMSLLSFVVVVVIVSQLECTAKIFEQCLGIVKLLTVSVCTLFVCLYKCSEYVLYTNHLLFAFYRLKFGWSAERTRSTASTFIDTQFTTDWRQQVLLTLTVVGNISTDESTRQPVSQPTIKAIHAFCPHNIRGCERTKGFQRRCRVRYRCCHRCCRRCCCCCCCCFCCWWYSYTKFISFSAACDKIACARVCACNDLIHALRHSGVEKASHE